MNKLFKRILSSVLCFIMIVSAIPLGELAGIDWNELLGLKALAYEGVEVGDIIEMGMYPQSKVTSTILKAELGELTTDQFGDVELRGMKYRKVKKNGVTNFYLHQPIEWKVLSVAHDGIFVVSLRLIEARSITSPEKYPSWSNCDLRLWLNGTFYNNFFSEYEKEFIKTSILINPSTTDKIFLLSYDDVSNSEYGFNSDSNRIAFLTDYTNHIGTRAYWLRNSGGHWTRFMNVNHSGSITTNGHSITDYAFGIRPAMKLYTGSEVNIVKNHSEYQFKAIDSETKAPLSGVNFEYCGTTYTSETDGTVTINAGSDDNLYENQVTITKDSYGTIQKFLYEFNPYSINTVSLQKDFGISEMLEEINIPGETIYGPTVSVLGCEFSLFKFEGKIKIPKLGNYLSVQKDKSTQIVKVLVGVKDEYKDQDEKTFKENYENFKSYYNALTNSSTSDSYKTSLYNKITHLTEKLDASYGFVCDVNCAGFLEFDYSTGELLFKDGGLTISANAGVSQDIPFGWFAYATFKIEGEIKGELKATLNRTDNLISFSSKTSLSVKPSVGIGAKLVSKNLASIEAGISGELTGSVTIPSESFFKAFELYLSGKCYVKGKALWIFETPPWEKEFVRLQLFPNLEIESGLSTQSISGSELSPIDRSYLYAPSLYSLDGINRNNVYPYGLPQLIELEDGRIVALYLFDDGTKSDINRTTLYYSIYETEEWSNPIPVFDSGFADFPVEVCTDGTNIYAVWQRASEVYEETFTEDEIACKTELVYAVYDGTSWSEPVTVDTSDKYQFAYDIAENNGEVTIAWAENNENDYFLMSGSTTVYKKTLADSVWSEEAVVDSAAGITEVAVGYILDSASVAYVVDTDGDLTTAGDNEIYIDGVAITSDSAEDYEVSYQNGAFGWIKDGVLYSYNGSVSSMGINVEGDYRIITNGTQTAVTYIATDGFKNEIMISYLLSDGTYSQPVALTDYDRHITFYDVILNDDGTTTLIADVENLSEEEGVYPYTTTDMVCEVLGKSVDLAVENVYADGAFTRGGTVYFNGTVVNKSTSAVDNYSIAVVDESGNILRSTTVWSDVFSGESESFSLEYILPEDFSKQNISVIVTVDEDKDTSNNFYEFELGYSDITVTGASINENGEITAIVVNNGCDTAENVTVDITAFGTEDTVLTTIDCGSIAPGETHNISFTVDSAYLEFDSPYVVNKFRIAAETSSVEVSTGNNDADAVYAPTPVEGITISSDKMTLISGSSTQLVATVYPSEAYNQKIHWVSDSTDVVTVDENGNIQAVSGGTAIITAISDDGGYVASCEVTSVVKVSSISMTEEKATINVGYTKTLKYVIDPDTASDKSVTWNSSDTSVATVSDTGVITALKSGVTTVTVTTVDGDFSDSCEITVINAVTGITISDVTASICLDNQKQLSAQVAPLDADNTSITWKSSDDYIVTVDETGLITGVGTGTATITATSVDGGYTATCEVTVGKHVSNVLLSEQTITIKPGLAHQLNATVLPLNATDKSVEWLSINENIAVVDENGVVTGVGLGTTSIVVSTIDGGYYAICEVVVTGYKVEYYSDGNLHFSEYLFEGEKLTMPDNPLKEGYTFEKWSPDVAETMSAENLVYEAVWNANVHNVSFIVEGETYHSYDCAYLDVITTPDIPQIEGYSFVGWTPSIPETMPNNDISFTAVFELATYTATFVADGTVISTQTFTIETESLDEPPVPQKAGYYACWSGYTIEAKDMTIVAKYYSPEAVMISKRTLDIGETYRLLPSCNFEVTDKSWKSSDTSVATVNQHGKVTAVGEGECRITVTCYGKDSLGNDIQASKSTKIIVNGKSETTNIKQSFREMFDEFFEVTLHDILYNFREFMIVLLRYAY